jgi:hypothetical protein
MSNGIKELQTRLIALETKKKEFEDNIRRKDELIPMLNSLKEKLLQYKQGYDEKAIAYALSLMELEEVIDRIKSLGTELGIEHLRDFLMDTTKLYGYGGNLGEGNTGLVIHESIVPATRGQELWRLIKSKKLEQR